MLPLWIIDITSDKSSRRDAFLRLVEKIDHVYIPDELRTKTEDKESDESVESDAQIENEESICALASNPGKMVKTVEEEIDEEERREAEKNAEIRGNYWYYSHFSNTFETELTEEQQNEFDEFIADHNNEKTEKGEPELTDEEIDIYLRAQKLYFFQEKVVREAAAFVHELRLSNAKPYQPINVIVLGDSTEEFSQMVFPSIAAILQKEKGRFLPGHIHQGMAVFGALFLPCDVNTLKVDRRMSILHMLDEIEVQHNISSVRGYDHMMLYQDVQNRTECTYPLMSAEEQAEYLLQCIVHLFLACDIHHPLISGTSSDDTFYFSMGAASVHFDMEVEDEKEANQVAQDLVRSFKEDGDREGEIEEKPKELLDKKLYEAKVFVKEFTKFEDLGIDDEEVKPFSPHPIADFFKKNLKRLYYQYQLRYYPAALLRQILTRIEEKTSVLLDKISNQSNTTYKAASMGVFPAISKRLAKVTENDGAMSYVECQLKGMQELLSKEKESLRFVLENMYWNRLLDGNLIPNNQKDYFEEYHITYQNDIATKNNGVGCSQARQDATTKLKDLLSKEKTVLATIGRTLFMGIICVLCILPLLDMVSPELIDLGNVKKNSFYWGIGVFLLPLLIQWISYMFYLRKRNKCVNVLKAYYTHDAYARLANRIEFEALECYNKLIALGDEYLKRCERIRKEIKIDLLTADAKMMFPLTMFNQPLNGGTFNGQEIIPASEIEVSRIKVNYVPRFVNELRRSHYYLLINRFSEEFSLLFRDIEVPDGHARRYNDETGSYEFVTKDQLEREREDNWERIKKNFQKELLKGIKSEMLPREYPTVGDKLIQYRKKIERYTLLEPLMSFAATNGELTSHADTEYADIKVNREINNLSTPYLPLYTTKTQVAKYEKMYEKYIFITRWRCFEHFSYNRILPNEDFDQHARETVNFEASNTAKEMKRKEQERLSTGGIKEEEPNTQEVAPYKPCHSSLIMWSICPDENSGEWLKLFESAHFGRAYIDREKYREILNQND